MKKRDIVPENIPIREALEAMLDTATPLPPKYLYRLSDLSQDDLELFKETWMDVPDWRRKAMLEDIQELDDANTVLNYAALGQMALRDPNPEVRALGIMLLWDYELIETVPQLLEMLNNDSSVTVREAAADGLGRFVYLGEIEELPEELLHKVENNLLRAATSQEDEAVRRSALISLSYSSREEVNPLIRKAYESNDRSWVATALFAMGRSGNEIWADSIAAMFNSQHPVIRIEAARAAGELQMHNALDPLLDMTEDDNDEVRMAAIWSLSQIGGEGVKQHLENLAKHTEDEDEIDFIEEALDNLTFTEDIELFTLYDMEEDEPRLTPVGNASGSSSRASAWKKPSESDEAEDDMEELEDDDLGDLDDIEDDLDLDLEGLDYDDDAEDDDLFDEDEFDEDLDDEDS